VLKKYSPALGPIFEEPLVRFPFLGREGALRLERIRSAAFSHALRRASLAEIGDQLAFAQISPTRHFDFFTTIGQ
jgi:hypothetical protein